jgi:hypothetical protein
MQARTVPTYLTTIVGMKMKERMPRTSDHSSMSARSKTGYHDSTVVEMLTKRFISEYLPSELNANSKQSSFP